MERPMQATVQRCELAAGFSISRVVTGLWQIADMERDDQDLDLHLMAAAMESYVDAGLTTFDMADHYGSAEEIAGLFLTEHSAGERAQMLTKWVPKPGRVTRHDVRAAVQRSLDRMRTDRLDLLQFHTWDYSNPAWLDSLFWLQELEEEGLIHHLGVTNFDTAHLRIALSSGISVVSNQVSFSLLDRRAAGAMTDLCLRHGIKLLAYGTVAGGFLTERWLGKAEPDWGDLKTWSEMKYRRFIEAAGGWVVFQGLLHTLRSQAQRYGVSMANVASRYILEEPAIGGVIIGARLGRSEHIEDNLCLFRFSLDEAGRSAIEGALGALQPIHGDCGDEYRKPPYLTASGDLSHHLQSMPHPYDVLAVSGGRTAVLSGTPWEELGGFCRAVRQGDRILVSGTTSAHGHRTIGGEDVEAQLHFVIDKIEGALGCLGSRLEDVVRTRIYIRNLSDWEAVTRVHGMRFRNILPVNTLVQAPLIGEEYLVEVEAEAVSSAPAVAGTDRARATGIGQEPRSSFPDYSSHGDRE